MFALDFPFRLDRNGTRNFWNAQLGKLDRVAASTDKNTNTEETSTVCSIPTRGANEVSAARAGDKAAPRPIVQIVYAPQGRETPRSDAPDTRRAILLIEDDTTDADRCRSVLQEMGYDGIQLITTLQQAEEYLDDVLNHLTHPPQAIVLDLGLGFDSGFGLLRKCHAHPRLREVPILVWSKSAESHTEALSARLGAKDFLVKSPDKEALRTTLQKLLAAA